MTLPSDRIAPLLGHLEMLLVSEDVELEPMGCAVLSVQGPRSASYLGIAESTEQLYPITVHGLDVIAAKCSRTGLPGYDLIVHKNDTTTVISYLTEQGAKIVNQQDINRFRIQAAIPEIGRDTSEKTLLLEAGLDDAVHWGKGCYLGQEVVRRQGDRGHTNKEIKRVEFEPGPLPSPGDEIWPKEESTKAAGILTSVAYGPDNVGYGLVILRRKHFAPGTPLVVRTSNGTIQCKVSGTRIRDHAVRRDENDPDLVGQTNKTHRALV
jgi:folate-binding protein YgfZ